MSKMLRTSTLVLGALTLSGCAFTNDVLQAAYDHKAEDLCSKTQSSYNTLTDPSQTAGCINGAYYAPPKLDKTKDKKTEKASFPTPY